MFDVVLFIIAMAATGGGGTEPASQPAEEASKVVQDGPTYQADPQTPSGKFTTATEIKPIMGATKMNWLALREYEGKDLLYVTQVWAWRCGLAGMRLGLNGSALADIPLPACHSDIAAPNAILPSDSLPYFSFDLGSVSRVEIELIYDDLSRDSASFERGSILMP